MPKQFKSMHTPGPLEFSQIRLWGGLGGNMEKSLRKL